MVKAGTGDWMKGQLLVRVSAKRDNDGVVQSFDHLIDDCRQEQGC